MKEVVEGSTARDFQRRVIRLARRHERQVACDVGAVGGGHGGDLKLTRANFQSFDGHQIERISRDKFYLPGQADRSSLCCEHE
jgi:hypothetical protein